MNKSNVNQEPQKRYNLSPVEEKIREVMHLIEGELPPHESLTNAIIKLNEANKHVSEFYDERIKDSEIGIQKLGWKLEKSFDHDVYHTNRYKLNNMIIDFTHEGERLESCELLIDEYIPVTPEAIVKITEALGTGKS